MELCSCDPLLNQIRITTTTKNIPFLIPSKNYFNNNNNNNNTYRHKRTSSGAAGTRTPVSPALNAYQNRYAVSPMMSPTIAPIAPLSQQHLLPPQWMNVAGVADALHSINEEDRTATTTASTTTTRRKLAILTSGGDAPGMNAAVRAVVRIALIKGCIPYAVMEGYEGISSSGS